MAPFSEPSSGQAILGSPKVTDHKVLTFSASAFRASRSNLRSVIDRSCKRALHPGRHGQGLLRFTHVKELSRFAHRCRSAEILQEEVNSRCLQQRYRAAQGKEQVAHCTKSNCTARSDIFLRVGVCSQPIYAQESLFFYLCVSGVRLRPLNLQSPVSFLSLHA